MGSEVRGQLRRGPREGSRSRNLTAAAPLGTKRGDPLRNRTRRRIDLTVPTPQSRTSRRHQHLPSEDHPVFPTLRLRIPGRRSLLSRPKHSLLEVRGRWRGEVVYSGSGVVDRVRPGVGGRNAGGCVSLRHTLSPAGRVRTTSPSPLRFPVSSGGGSNGVPVRPGWVGEPRG